MRPLGFGGMCRLVASRLWCCAVHLGLNSSWRIRCLAPAPLCWAQGAICGGPCGHSTRSRHRRCLVLWFQLWSPVAAGVLKVILTPSRRSLVDPGQPGALVASAGAAFHVANGWPSLLFYVWLQISNGCRSGPWRLFNQGAAERSP